MTQFRVLPMRYGDAYLLRGPRGGYLVDGGGPEEGLAAQLADRRTRGLRAAVCSLPTPGRLCGLLELMEVQYPVAEYWLPEGLASLPAAAARFDGDWAGWRRQILSTEPDTAEPAALAEREPCFGTVRGALREGWPGDSRLRGAAMLVALALTGCLDAALAVHMAHLASDMGNETGTIRFLGRALAELAGRMRPVPDASATARAVIRLLEVAGWRMLSGGDPADLVMVCGRLLLALSARPGQSESGPLLRNLALAAMAAAQLDRVNARVRFFRPLPWLEGRLVPRHPMKCLNGTEVPPLAGLPDAASPAEMVRRVRRMADPDSALVFVYGEAGCGALLCSGTRLMFLDRGDSIRLDRPSVVTAPRCGSATAERAYPFIVSDHPGRNVWVRGFLPPTRKVASSFEAQQTKICLNNCRTLAMQEVLLVFEGGHWNREAGGDCVYG
ncbi:hypothetical protein GKC30_06470 [Pseudodesulfovibrio sp. F-1]|uniref:Uncharacterized protein n=1 Tax=Pseudodesulfovibrio alkaliphilus TaxID=2661613 RepID=A0A7K1KMV7_9BACT|nr:hypothetical protein [Pseudodesulfovibrio alkaliphilus]MUM77271.1 hypothetical protein [Pseudodesulfovibrio alkaliphilus]